MPRARTIKPQFLRSNSMSRVSREARLTFIHLWLVADDAGRAVDHPVALPRRLYPGQIEAQALVAGWLAELEREHCIERYTVGRDSYLRIVNWRRYQKVYHPTPSQLPGRPVSRAAHESLGNKDEEANDTNGLVEVSGISERVVRVVTRSERQAENAGRPASPPVFPSDSRGGGFFSKIAGATQRALARG